MSTPSSPPPPPPPVSSPQKTGIKGWIKRHKILTVVIALIVIGGIATAGGGSKDTDKENKKTEKTVKSSSEADDVKLIACTDDALGFVQADLEATNSSSKKSDYLVTVAIESADGKTKYGDATAYITGVEPGQTAKQTASAFDKAEPGYVCRISDVNRSASL